MFFVTKLRKVLPCFAEIDLLQYFFVQLSHGCNRSTAEESHASTSGKGPKFQIKLAYDWESYPTLELLHTLRTFYVSHFCIFHNFAGLVPTLQCTFCILNNNQMITKYCGYTRPFELGVEERGEHEYLENKDL